MHYNEIKQGYFIARPNRFIAHIELDGQVEVCHVKNTGRCRELLTPRAVVYVECHHDPRRKTKYSLIAVRKGSLLINMDSQAPNKVVAEWLASGELLPGLTLLKPECRYGTSRFDFYVETPQQKLFIEVKGVTLEENGIAMFPDAPTERGIKHLDELAQAVRLCRRGDFCDPDARCDQVYTKSPHTCGFCRSAAAGTAGWRTSVGL